MDIMPFLLAVAIVAATFLAFTLAHYIWEAKFYKGTSEYWHKQSETAWAAYYGARDEVDEIKDRILHEQCFKAQDGRR